jgi:hypothetical protein
MRVSYATDNRLLLAGVAASLALVVYLAVAFANTHASNSPAAAGPGPFAPWVPKYHSTLALVPRRRGGGIEVHVSRGWIGAYGAVVPTLVAQPPPGHKIVVSLRLRGLGKVPIEVLVDEFPAGPSPNLFVKMVPATARWHRYTFRTRVKGRWLGLGMYVGRSTNGAASKWFALDDLNVEVR